MLAPVIPKEPDVPKLSSCQTELQTEIVFYQDIEPLPCDALFVFSGTHPGHWEKAIEAYLRRLASTVIVTGGISPTGKKHPDWPDSTVPEADVIVARLVEGGVKQDDIVFENRSRHTLENVLFAKDVFDFSQIGSLMFVCKSHAAGRQYRTLAQHFLPNCGTSLSLSMRWCAAYPGLRHN